MLRTGKQVWEASAKRSALGIRQAELNFHIERYGALIGQCSFLAGFSFESIVHLEVPEDTSYVISSIFFVSLSLAVMCSVYVVVVGSGLIIFGHQLALMGSEGESLELAVHHLRERRFSVFLAGFTAFFSLISAAVALSWIKMGPIAIYVSLTFGFMTLWTFVSLSSIWHDIGNRQLVTGETKFYTPNGHFDLATLQPNVAGPNVLASHEQHELEQIESSRQRPTSASLTNLSAFFADSRKEIV